VAGTELQCEEIDLALILHKERKPGCLKQVLLDERMVLVP